MNRLMLRYGPGSVIVHGADDGIDSTFADACDDMGIDYEPPPAGRSMGLKAGPVRNQAIVSAGASVCLDFHQAISASKGTKDCCRRAVKAGIPTFLIDSDRAEPKRLRQGAALLE